MGDVVIASVMVGAVLAYAGVTYLEVRNEERKQKRLQAEEDAERDRRLEMMRRGADWAMSMTPREWVKS